MNRVATAIAAGLIHFVLAAAALTIASWAAIRSNGGRCDDTPTCIEVNVWMLVLNTIGYAVAFVLWTGAQRRLLQRLLDARPARQPTSVVAHLVTGLCVLALGLTLGEVGMWIAIALASLATPSLATWWASQPSDSAEPYRPIWRRPGW